MSTTSADNVKDQVQEVVEAPKQFFKDGIQFVNRCRKPDQKGKFLKKDHLKKMKEKTRFRGK